MTASTHTTREEHDLLGVREVPATAAWGIHTLRACENFPFAGPRVHGDLLRALVQVKRACARSNRKLGYLPATLADAIESACAAALADPAALGCPLPALQGGAGTSTNMFVNEWLANAALASLGGAAGDYAVVNPIGHVNLHQSTNDVYPTAVRVALIDRLRRAADLIASLQGALQRREEAWRDVVTVARTEMQDAVPITLGGQFAAYAEAVGRDRWRMFKATERLRSVNLGGTAVGTGLTAPRDYIFAVIEDLRAVTGQNLARADQAMDATSNVDPLVEVGGMLSAHAANLGKISRDLRLLHAFGEVLVPAVQAGSTVMPGKVNPVVLEAVIQAAMKAQALIAVVGTAAAEGSFQINEFLPLIAEAMLESFDLLEGAGRACAALVDGLVADEERCRARVEASPTLITALLPRIGYERAQALLREFADAGRRDIRRFLEERVGAEAVSEALSPAGLMALGYRRREGAAPTGQ
jgi:aspartate ammonia-lyase